MADGDDRLVEVFTKVMQCKKEDVKDDTSADSLNAWNSLNHLLLISEVEKEFSINIPFEESMGITTYKALRETVDGILDS